MQTFHFILLNEIDVMLRKSYLVICPKISSLPLSASTKDNIPCEVIRVLAQLQKWHNSKERYCSKLVDIEMGTFCIMMFK